MCLAWLGSHVRERYHRYYEKKIREKMWKAGKPALRPGKPGKPESNGKPRKARKAYHQVVWKARKPPGKLAES